MKKIIGCGNLLLRDEGVGIHLIEFLREKALPEDVELVDAATGGFDIIPHLQGAEKIVIVDAIKADGKPGDIYRFLPGDFSGDSSPNTSLHDITLQEVLALAKKLSPLPPIVIFGVQPKVIDWGMELTEDLQKVVPRLSELVLEELQHA